MAYDISVARPEVRVDDVKPRGREYPVERRAQIRKGLTSLHTLEVMAANIYKSQITAKPCELNTKLTAAMLNEMTHIQDFQVKLYEFGFKPSKLRWTYWLVGYVFGLGSRLRGPRWILKTGVWVEAKAIEHYSQLLQEANWDEVTRRVIEKNRADEQGHIERWRSLLKNPDPIC